MAYEGQSFQLHWYSMLTAFFQGHNSVRGHTRDSACNSETNVTLFQSYTSRSYFNIPTAGLHSTLGTNLSAVVPSSTPTTPKEVWQDDKPGHDPPHHFEEGNVPVALFTGSSVTQAVHPRFFQEPTNSNLSTVSFDNSHAVWTRSRHPNGPSYQLDEMPGIEQTLLATGSNSLYAQYPHRYYNNANIPVFQLNSREGGISIEDHGLPQRIPAVLAPNHQLQLRLEEFMMAHRPFLSTVPSSHPDHMARLRGEFEDYLKLHGIVCSQAEVERIFAQFKPTIGSPASRIERNSKMTRGQTPKAYCPFQFCGSPFTRLSNLRYHLSAHFGLTPNECLNCGKSFSGSSIKRHKDTCKGSEWSGKK
ncbi:hypothetical protein BJ912DRAFT_155861 [Pholiota molesta]|nr:hypothetical protein BJ912DRAFT_155861 [Pholiota molesta]